MRKTIKSLILAAMTAPAFIACNEVDVYEAPKPYTIDWSAAADSATNSLIEYFWNPDGYFNQRASSNGREDNGKSWNYWPQAHAMDVVIAAYERTGNPEYSALFPLWMEGIKTQNDGGNTGGYLNDFYDDEAWIALTMTRLHNATGEARYLDEAKAIYEDIKGGWNDEYGGGGVAWRKSMPWSKNACINGPASVLAFRLYDITDDKAYADFGLKTYDWLRENLMNPATGEIADNMNGETGEIANWNFSYNQGTVMAAALAAYRYTGDELYLKDARRVADYGISSNSFLDRSTNTLMKENGTKPASDNDVALFRAVFFHYLHDIVTAEEFDDAWHRKFTACLNSSADYLWRHGVVDKRWVLFSGDWQNGVQPGSTAYLNAMVSACAAIEARAKVR